MTSYGAASCTRSEIGTARNTLGTGVSLDFDGGRRKRLR